MLLEGSCQCQKVRFRVESDTPYPYQRCYCSICRKLEGTAFGVNLMGRRATLRVTGKKHLKVYHPVIRRPGERPVTSGGERWFCGECGTHLYVLDPEWPDGVWPNAGAVDTELPVPPESVHMMLSYKPAWVEIGTKGPRYSEYSELSIAEWHAQHAPAPRRKRAA